jgi:hypothetical protein
VSETDRTIPSKGELLGRVVLTRFSEPGINDDTDDEFVDKLASVVDRLADLHPGLTISSDLLNLFGYGDVFEVLKSETTSFMFGHDFAAALNWDAAQFNRLIRQEYLFDVEQQREHDVETGTVGWNCFNYWPARVSVWSGDGLSKDHYDSTGSMRGPIMGYWTDVWLIDTSRLMYLMMLSPWGKEFFEAARPMMAWGFTKSGLLGGAKDVKTYTTRVNALGEPEAVETGTTLAGAITDDRQGLTEQEAIARAMRGPVPPDLHGGDTNG